LERVTDLPGFFDVGIARNGKVMTSIDLVTVMDFALTLVENLLGTKAKLSVGTICKDSLAR
jgi:hypothetical protein